MTGGPPRSSLSWRRWSGWLDLAWVLLWMLGLAGIMVFARWEAVPFHLIWVSFALLYGFRIRKAKPTFWVLTAMVATTFAAIGLDVVRGAQPPAELTEVPLMAAMVWVMMWHAHRRQAADAERVRVSERERAAARHSEPGSSRTHRISSGPRSRSRSATPSCWPAAWRTARRSAISTWSSAS